jgi:lambda family phage minor tail protein L
MLQLFIDGILDASVNYTTETDPEISCPYQGASYFNDAGDITEEPSEDSCGRRLRDCKLRFGSVSPLPFDGFPNIKRFMRNR